MNASQANTDGYYLPNQLEFGWCIITSDQYRNE